MEINVLNVHTEHIQKEKEMDALLHRVTKGLGTKGKIIVWSIVILIAIVGIVLTNISFGDYLDNRKENAAENASQILEDLQPAKDAELMLNTKEFTNAIDKFMSEYEMFKNDLFSGFFDVNNMSVTQAKIYNITFVTNRQKLEDFENTKLDKKTGYPSDKQLVKNIILLHSKNGSLLNRNDGYSYWYTPSCGVVVCASDTITIQELNSMVNRNDIVLDNNTVWLNVSK